MEYKDSLLVNDYGEWWSNGEKKVIGQYTDNKKDGQWTYYDSGGTILLEDKYSGWLDRGGKYAPSRRSRYEYYHSGELVSSYNFEYYSNGQLKEEPSFTKGIFDGVWIEYFNNGEEFTKRGYSNGKPDGGWITWHDFSFVKAQKMTFVDSLLEGIYSEWWNDERPKVLGYYIHDKKDSLWTYRDKFDHERFEEYEMGELISSWGWEYYENGQVKEEIVYNDGMKQGEWYAYYENGDYRGLRNFKDGQRNGSWIDWYTNDQKSFERSYELDRKTGKWTFWYFSGELMSEVHYENNELISQRCYQSVSIYGNPEEKFRTCADIIKPEDMSHGVFRKYSSSDVLMNEFYILNQNRLAQFEYHPNGKIQVIKLIHDGETVFQKEWDPTGIEKNDETQRQGLFSTWDYFPNGDLKYKVTYKGFQKKMKSLPNSVKFFPLYIW